MKLAINLTNCYGIKKLDTEFDFSDKNTEIIYAPNGLMKSSFANTFKDLSNEREPCDRAFPDRESIANITKDNQNIPARSIFVIEPYNSEFKSEKISTLLVNENLKQQYEEIYHQLDNSKKELIKKLQDISESADCEKEFTDTFKENDNQDFYDLLDHINHKLDDNTVVYDFKYNYVFDKGGKVKDFLEKNQKNINSYITQYDKLISESDFFNKSSNFGTFQAQNILNSVKDGSFFNAEHKLNLKDGRSIDTKQALEETIETELKTILEDKELKKIFNKMDTELNKNQDLRNFKSVIEKNYFLLAELDDYENLRKKVWYGYFVKLADEIERVLGDFNSKKQEIKSIKKQAESEKTIWEETITEFNQRFKSLPFSLNIANKNDTILKGNLPSIVFSFHDRETVDLEEDALVSILSQGEKRALYLLNIIFELKVRQNNDVETILIVDDIADSFDYKNKYAIIQYLNDNLYKDNFYQIVLTHNFDFFRAIQSRFFGFGNRKNSKMAIKNDDGEIFLKESAYFKPFDYFKKNINSSNAILIALIPFTRNLIEYIYGDNHPSFQKITSFLHIKDDTKNLNLSDIQDLFQEILGIQSTYIDNNFINFITQTADDIVTEAEVDELNLENKITLSIAIRLKSEEFLRSQINDDDFLNNIHSNQTYKLIEKYKESSENRKNLEILEEISLMTPENIHFNSFMYEPILDLGIEHLKDLYKKTKDLQA